MEDVESQMGEPLPEQFDEVVDIIANEQRERGEQIVEYQEKTGAVKDFDQISEAASEVLDENGKPFWMKFFKEDYLGETKKPSKSLTQKGKGQQTQQ